MMMSVNVDRIHFKVCFIEMLQHMFGADSVPKIFEGCKRKYADIDLVILEVECAEGESFQQIV